MERRQTPHPLQGTTISAMIKCNCPRLVIGFGHVSVHVNGPVWQLAYNDQNEALLSCEKHTYTCGSLLCDCDQWKDKLEPGKQHLSYMCAFCVCLQSYWLPNIPRVIRPVSGMRGKVIKKKVNLFLSTRLRHAGGTEVQLCPLVTSALGGGEWSASSCDLLTPRKEPR
jgi:hypothetical protein